MDCATARELGVTALTEGRPRPEEVERHLGACAACREELDGLGLTWTALEALPVVEPSPAIAVRLRRRIRWEMARETLGSPERWQQAALVGVVGFVLSVLLGLVLPYESMVAACRRMIPSLLPTPLAYVAAGALYGFLPLLIGAALEARRTWAPGLVGALEAPLVFLATLVPYVVLRCGDFPLALLAGFVAGIAFGAIAGGGAGAWLGRRRAWT